MLNSRTKEKTQLQDGDRVYFVVSAMEGTEIIFYRPQEDSTNLLLLMDDGRETLLMDAVLTQESCEDIVALLASAVGSLFPRPLAPSNMPSGRPAHRFLLMKS